MKGRTIFSQKDSSFQPACEPSVLTWGRYQEYLSAESCPLHPNRALVSLKGNLWEHPAFSREQWQALRLHSCSPGLCTGSPHSFQACAKTKVLFCMGLCTISLIVTPQRVGRQVIPHVTGYTEERTQESHKRQTNQAHTHKKQLWFLVF